MKFRILNESECLYWPILFLAMVFTVPLIDYISNVRLPSLFRIFLVLCPSIHQTGPLQQGTNRWCCLLVSLMAHWDVLQSCPVDKVAQRVPWINTLQMKTRHLAWEQLQPNPQPSSRLRGFFSSSQFNMMYSFSPYALVLCYITNSSLVISTVFKILAPFPVVT